MKTFLSDNQPKIMETTLKDVSKFPHKPRWCVLVHAFDPHHKEYFTHVLKGVVQIPDDTMYLAFKLATGEWKCFSNALVTYWEVYDENLEEGDD